MSTACHFTVMDPTGNITALVETPIPPGERLAAAEAVMRRCPKVEQVGFVSFSPVPSLEMAGGEFCGNASLSTAALLWERGFAPREGDSLSVDLKVSGADEPVAVSLRRTGQGIYDASITMPPPLEMGDSTLAYGGTEEAVPLVRMRGITHAIISPRSTYYHLLDDRHAAENAVRAWCYALGAEGLGLMFVEGELPEMWLTPLVFILSGETVFWEHSCASGSAAAGAFYSALTGREVSLVFHEPGGTLRVACSPGGSPVLRGSVRVLGEDIAEI